MITGIGEALISEDKRYRYLLTRQLRTTRRPRKFPCLGIVMLNPSTADANTDDPTIRRCCSFAMKNGYGSILVANLFALRCTDPVALDLRRAQGDDYGNWRREIIGPDGEDYWSHFKGKDVLVAWGALGPEWRVKWVVEKLRQHKARRLLCLGTTTSGAPRHPLYLPDSAQLREWGTP